MSDSQSIGGVEGLSIEIVINHLKRIADAAERQADAMSEISARLRKDTERSSLTTEERALMLVQKHRGNKSAIAREIGCSERTIYRMPAVAEACARYKRRPSRSRPRRGIVDNGNIDAREDDWQEQIDEYLDRQERK